ncbi:hypothetical protein C7974DRAFT_405871 [Boeremia exigua]|uniref:uncharacterized protein n=1 Tax=Boeremia exigua TaxID=749465 RepID=UPI001E8D50F7|nr:uncharacterized protein C7974DRAFT_405871 [Boeremia exigua]KAH6612581.1 hypothetical protein C7974DRAFT_405871 [Boeremia exigua]
MSWQQPQIQSYTFMFLRVPRACSIIASAANCRPPRPFTRSLTTATKTMLDPTQPVHWILDWDGTISQHDTLDALVSISASAKPGSPVLDEWNRVSEAYVSDYTAAIARLAPEGNLPKTIQKEKLLLHALKSVEQASLDRVSSSGIFAGLTRKLLGEGTNELIKSKRVEIRPGFTEFLGFSQTRGNDHMNLLSVNWSRYFIDCCLGAAGATIQRDSIYANELDGIECGSVSHGQIGPSSDADMLIISSGDKLEHMDRLRKQHHESRNSNAALSTPAVYVGDSWTDIECLLEADLGICIRDEPLSSSQKKLSERLQSLGVRCPHLSAWSESDAVQVVWARNFHEIKEWVQMRKT